MTAAHNTDTQSAPAMQRTKYEAGVPIDDKNGTAVKKE